MKETNLSPSPDSVFTYRRLRRSIGYLGASLPIVLILLSFIKFFNTPIQPSISHYYYTNFRELFTGTLCAVGLFLLRYKGIKNKKWWLNDNLLTNIAGLMAFGVAFIPTNPTVPADKIYTLIPVAANWLGWLHYGFAAILFLSFSNLAINVFTIGQKVDINTPVSIWNENSIYRFCGWSIIVCIVLVPILYNQFKYSTLILEMFSLFSFGIAWLIKGRALGDKGAIGRKVYRENNS